MVLSTATGRNSNLKAVAYFDPAWVGVALSMARHFGASAQDAEDIAQEALLKLLTYGAAVRDPVAWLYVVTRRLRYQAVKLPGQTTERPARVDPWPEVELQIDARRLLAGLSSRDRTSILLSVAGFTERETADRLGCSIKATEKSLHRARRHLRASRNAVLPSSVRAGG